MSEEMSTINVHSSYMWLNTIISLFCYFLLDLIVDGVMYLVLQIQHCLATERTAPHKTPPTCLTLNQQKKSIRFMKQKWITNMRGQLFQTCCHSLYTVLISIAATMQ